MKTIYEYATKSWPVIKGCAMDLACADRCWARRECHRLAANPCVSISVFHRDLTDSEGKWTGVMKLNRAHLQDPLSWRQPQRVAVAFHGDWMLADVDDGAEFWCVMAEAERHDFLLLSKHHTSLLPVAISYLRERVAEAWERFDGGSFIWPLPNVWVGISIMNQGDADVKLPHLLRTVARKRWISLEPMLGPVNLKPYLATLGIDWVVLGGETGLKARSLRPEWVRQVRDDCQAAGVPFFFKQWGCGYPGPAHIDGRAWREIPISAAVTV